MHTQGDKSQAKKTLSTKSLLLNINVWSICSTLSSIILFTKTLTWNGVYLISRLEPMWCTISLTALLSQFLSLIHATIFHQFLRLVRPSVRVSYFMEDTAHRPHRYDMPLGSACLRCTCSEWELQFLHCFTSPFEKEK